MKRLFRSRQLRYQGQVSLNDQSQEEEDALKQQRQSFRTTYKNQAVISLGNPITLISFLALLLSIVLFYVFISHYEQRNLPPKKFQSQYLHLQEKQQNALKEALQRFNKQFQQQSNQPYFDPQIYQVEQLIPDKFEWDLYQDKYFFSTSIREVIMNSQLETLYQDNKRVDKISKRMHIRAILRTQLVHNIQFDGSIKVELTKFDRSKKQKLQSIQSLLDDQQFYYEKVYKISEYQNRQLRFCIVVPSYNNIKNKLYLRNLDSIFQQDYKNYHVVYLDDNSPQKTGQFVNQYIKDRRIPEQKIKVYINQVNKKAMANIYDGIHSHCPNGEIVVLVDGDDSLIGRKVLKLYNAIYQRKNAMIIYSNFLKILQNKQTSVGFAYELTDVFFYQNKLRTEYDLMGTHLMSFYSDIFKMIDKKDFCYDNGTFLKYAYDRAIITPLAQMTYPHIVYVPQMLYEYRNDTGLNDGTKLWEQASKVVQDKLAYKPLQKFPFLKDAHSFILNIDPYSSTVGRKAHRNLK